MVDARALPCMFITLLLAAASLTTVSASYTTVSSLTAWHTQLNAASAAGKSIVVEFCENSGSAASSCLPMTAEFAHLSTQYPKVIFLYVDFNAGSAIAAAAGVNTLPTFQTWKKTKKVYTYIGTDTSYLDALVQGA